MQPRAMRAGWLGDVRVARAAGPRWRTGMALDGLSEVPQGEGGAPAEGCGETRAGLGSYVESPTLFTAPP